ncbi:MAG: spermidine/putrescine ABC transporter substrate-binding protein, partial [Bdellovibrionales bacterium]|nr:spermidine/putrescine ABC transporter substrate-binding protein [Bdellovibrionales bacterium]
NLAAKALLPESVRNNRGIFPTPEQEARVAFLPERKDLMLLIDKLWTEFKLE